MPTRCKLLSKEKKVQTTPLRYTYERCSGKPNADWSYWELNILPLSFNPPDAIKIDIDFHFRACYPKIWDNGLLLKKLQVLSVGPCKHHTRVRIEVKKLASGTETYGSCKAIDGLELLK